MGIASEITRLQTAKAGLKTAIEAKGVTVLSSTTIDGYPALVSAIPSGGGADLASLDVYIADYLGDAPTITTGALDILNRRIYGT